MAKTPVLYTERLRLRPMEESDFNDFYAYFSTDEVRDAIGGYTPGRPDAIRAIFDNNCQADYTWALELLSENKVIGDTHFGNIIGEYLAHIGYVLHPGYWGHGYATEALAKITAFGFDTLDFGRIRAILLASNRRSEMVLRRCGYHKEAFIREGDFGGRVENLLYYSKGHYEMDGEMVE